MYTYLHVLLGLQGKYDPSEIVYMCVYIYIYICIHICMNSWVCAGSMNPVGLNIYTWIIHEYPHWMHIHTWMNIRIYTHNEYIYMDNTQRYLLQGLRRKHDPCRIAWIADCDLRLRVETSSWVIAFSRTHRDMHTKSISVWDCLDYRLWSTIACWNEFVSHCILTNSQRRELREYIYVDCRLWSTIVRWNKFVSHCILTNSQRRDLREYLYVGLLIMIYDCALKRVRESLHSHTFKKSSTYHKMSARLECDVRFCVKTGS